MLKLFQIIICFVAIYPVLSISAELRFETDVGERISRASEIKTNELHAYRLKPKAVSSKLFELFRTTVGTPVETEFDMKRGGFFYENGDTRNGAIFDAFRGRYVCFRESKSDFSSKSAFPPRLTERAKELLAEFSAEDGEYIPTAMNAQVLQEPGGGAPLEFKRTYIFNRRLDGRTVLSDDGRVTIQFNRAGDVSYAEVPTVDFTPVALYDQIEPRETQDRFYAFARTLDTVQMGTRIVHIDSVVVDAIALTFIREERNGVAYLVPYQTARMLMVSSAGERIQREQHFSLDTQSRRYVPVDSWLLNR